LPIGFIHLTNEESHVQSPFVRTVRNAFRGVRFYDPGGSVQHKNRKSSLTIKAHGEQFRFKSRTPAPKSGGLVGGLNFSAAAVDDVIQTNALQ